MTEYGFDLTIDCHRFVCKEKEGEKGTSEITIYCVSCGGKIVKRFDFPTYKIWNIPAHAEDIISGLKQNSDRGLKIAGSDGLGGNAYQGGVEKNEKNNSD